MEHQLFLHPGTIGRGLALPGAPFSTASSTSKSGFDFDRPERHIKVPEAPDLQVNQLFGFKLDGPGWSDLAGRRAMIGTLFNNQVWAARFELTTPCAQREKHGFQRLHRLRLISNIYN